MDIAAYIEHTNLKPTLTISDVDKLVEEARQFGFIGVCIPPFWVKRARREIGNEKIFLVTVAGFPLGYNMTETKLDEIQRAIDNGADEIDVVWNVSAFKTGLPWTKVDIAKCSSLVHNHQKLLKVILETAYLSDAEIERGCKICADAGVDFVKTSTGFASALYVGPFDSIRFRVCFGSSRSRGNGSNEVGPCCCASAFLSFRD